MTSELKGTTSKPKPINITMQEFVQEKVEKKVQNKQLKTPVAVLQELGDRRNVTVKYEINNSTDGFFKATAKFDKFEGL